MGAHPQLDLRQNLRLILDMPGRGSLDIGDDRMGLVRAAVDHQPARAFRNPHPHHEHDEAEAGAGQIGQPPADVGIDHGGIEQHDRAYRADRRADPETAVDHQVGPAAIARRHQFLNGRIDRGIFAADPGAGQEAEQRVARDIPGQRRGCGGGEIDRERDEEQLLAPHPVGEPAEAERAEHGAGEIGAVGKPDIEIRESERRAFLQRARQRTRKRDLQTVEDPGDPERQHHPRVKAAPAQIIEPHRNRGLDDAVIVLRARTRHHRDAELRCVACEIHPTNEKPSRNAARPRFPIPIIAANRMPATGDNAGAAHEFPQRGIGTDRDADLLVINRAGKTLPKTQRARLERAKVELKHQFGRE